MRGRLVRSAVAAALLLAGLGACGVPSDVEPHVIADYELPPGQVPTTLGAGVSVAAVKPEELTIYLVRNGRLTAVTRRVVLPSVRTVQRERTCKAKPFPSAPSATTAAGPSAAPSGVPASLDTTTSIAADGVVATLGTTTVPVTTVPAAPVPVPVSAVTTSVAETASTRGANVRPCGSDEEELESDLSYIPRVQRERGQAIIDTLLAGPTAAERSAGFGSELESIGLATLDQVPVAYSDNTGEVETLIFKSFPVPTPSTVEMRLALGQIVYTLTHLRPNGEIRFRQQRTIDGPGGVNVAAINVTSPFVDVAVVDGAGRVQTVPAPVVRRDYAALAVTDVGEPVTIFLVRDAMLVPVVRSVRLPKLRSTDPTVGESRTSGERRLERAVAQHVLDEVARGATESEAADNIDSALGAIARNGDISLLGLVVTAIDGGAATVELGRFGPSSGTSDDQRAALAQIVFTLSDLPFVDRVNFTVDRIGVPVVDGEGVLRGPPIEALGIDDFAAFAPPPGTSA